MGGSALDNKLRFSAGLLQFNMTDGLDGNDETHSTGGHGLLTYNVSPTANYGAAARSDDGVHTNVSPTASGVPAANIPNAVIVPAIPVSVDQITRANQGLPFDIGNATYIPGRDDPDSTRDSSFYSTALVFRHSGWAPVSWQASYQRVHTDRTFINGVLGGGFQPTAESFGNYKARHRHHRRARVRQSDAVAQPDRRLRVRARGLLRQAGQQPAGAAAHADADAYSSERQRRLRLGAVRAAGPSAAGGLLRPRAGLFYLESRADRERHEQPIRRRARVGAAACDDG